jgi:hypothetical protein
VLEKIMFVLKDFVSSLKLLIIDAEYLLDFVFSLLMILLFIPYSVKLNSESSCFIEL